MGCSSPFFASPSMVVTSAPSACSARMVQLFTDSPSTCTTQAPHWLVSQPTWVPVRCRCSRRNWTSRVRSEEHTSELQSLMRISYAVFCLKKKTSQIAYQQNTHKDDRHSRK